MPQRLRHQEDISAITRRLHKRLSCKVKAIGFFLNPRFRLAAAYDCWGRRRFLRYGTRGGIWFLDPTGLDAPASNDAPPPSTRREQQLIEFVASGRFTTIELATLRALIVERLTIDEIARRDGCTRQAVMARLVGNSKGQGGILKKARSLAPPGVVE